MRSLGDLAVVTAGQSDAPENFPFADRFQRAWFSLQKELARLSPNTIHVVATNSGHAVMSHLGHPELVVEAVREVVAAARGERELGQCEQVFPPTGRRCISSP